MSVCRFIRAWIGPCSAPIPCKIHENTKCVSCEGAATHECEETGQSVCGAKLCDECEHTIAADGTNGGIGLYRTAPLPEGCGTHVRKDKQVYTPWYERKLEAERSK